MFTLFLITVTVILICRAMTNGNDDDYGDPQVPCS
jgi:hypothetical protein